MKEKKADILTDVKYLLEELQHSLGVVSEGITLLNAHFKGPPDVKRDQMFGFVQTNMERAQAVLNGVIESFIRKPLSAPAAYFDMLQHIQQVCSAHDQLFLQRQLRYRVTASADLPKVFANPDQIFMVLSHLISNAIKFGPRGSEIEIKLKEVSLRQGAGVEASVTNESANFTEKDRYQLFEKFYNTKGSKVEGIGLAVCREIIQKSCGQLWVDIPAKGKVAFAFVLPCVEIDFPVDSKNQQTYKYDITIANYKEIKEQFGGDKSSLLLSRIEDHVRTLIRHPIDVVTTFENSGIISIIYETHEEHAGSISTRISHKLGSENYRIGKSPIEVTFKYHLSVLQ